MKFNTLFHRKNDYFCKNYENEKITHSELYTTFPLDDNVDFGVCDDKLQIVAT